MDDARILQFAQAEAGDLPVAFHVSPASGDGYTIERNGAGHRITGTNARSCLHGVYHLRQGRPPGAFHAAFNVRGVNTCESLGCHAPGQLRQLLDRMGRWRMNTLIVHTCYGWRRQRDLIIEECGKRGIELVFYVYTSIVFLPPDAPAQWLAKKENGEPRTRRPECETRPCLNEPDGLRAFEDGARRFFANDCGPATSVLAMTGDGYGHCRCPACRPLSAVDQWQPLLQRFINAGRAHAPTKKLETISYVHRFRPPRDMSIHRRLDRLMFDLFCRNRWRPLGEPHPPIPDREAEADPEAGRVPINVYLWDRLQDWRAEFPGKLYVFEDLCVHGVSSCPQPNTGVLLEDLRRFRQRGLDGVVYELLNGMESFTAQMNVLADGLWNPDAVTYTPTPVEHWLRENAPPHPVFFLKPYGFPWERFGGEWDGHLRQHMANVRDATDQPTPANVKRLIEHLYVEPDRFHRFAIAFNHLKLLHRRHPLPNLTETEHRFLTITKLWDFMEPLEQPREAVDQIIHGLLKKL